MSLPLGNIYRTLPLNIGHRGARTMAPENTIKAFSLAMDQGADGVELDVWLSQDGHLVVIHDGDVSRTTNGAGEVNALSLATLLALDAGQGERIPTLDEVFKALPDQAVVNIEIKDYRANVGVEKAVMEVVDRHAAQHRIVISAFDPDTLRRMRVYRPDVALGYLTMGGNATPLSIDYQAEHPHFSTTTPEFVRQAHEQNHRVNVWTVNEVEMMNALRAAGVDSIITDYPDRLAALLKS
jgi:glycerophosphoryl diester phosphodiesterase